MERAINQLHPNINERIARVLSGAHGLLDARFHCRNELARNCSTSDLVLKAETFSCLCRLHVDDIVTVLAASTRLPDESRFNLLNSVTNRLSISDLRTSHVSVHLELAQSPINDDLQVELTHAGDDGLTRLLISAHAESGILIRQLHQALVQAILVRLGLRFYCHPYDGLGELHGP